MKPFAFSCLGVVLLALLAAGAAGAQVIRCTDPASGKTVYTDQPCRGGELLVPPLTDAERQAEAARAAVARQHFEQQRERERDEQRTREQADRRAAAAQAARAREVAAQECRQAREQAEARAASVTATPEQMRTARSNAALACGQAPAPEWGPVVPHVLRPPPAQPWGAASARPGSSAARATPPSFTLPPPIRINPPRPPAG